MSSSLRTSAFASVDKSLASSAVNPITLENLQDSANSRKRKAHLVFHGDAGHHLQRFKQFYSSDDIKRMRTNGGRVRDPISRENHYMYSIRKSRYTGPYRRFALAIESKNYAALKRLIETEPDLSPLSAISETPLYVAFLERDERAVGAFLTSSKFKLSDADRKNIRKLFDWPTTEEPFAELLLRFASMLKTRGVDWSVSDIVAAINEDFPALAERLVMIVPKTVLNRLSRAESLFPSAIRAGMKGVVEAMFRRNLVTRYLAMPYDNGRTSVISLVLTNLPAPASIVRRLLALGLGPNDGNPPPLEAAIAGGHAAIAMALLDIPGIRVGNALLALVRNERLFQNPRPLLKRIVSLSSPENVRRARDNAKGRMKNLLGSPPSKALDEVLNSPHTSFAVEYGRKKSALVHLMQWGAIVKLPSGAMRKYPIGDNGRGLTLRQLFPGEIIRGVRRIEDGLDLYESSIVPPRTNFNKHAGTDVPYNKANAAARTVQAVFRARRSR